jgi:hypothetical protein
MRLRTPAIVAACTLLAAPAAQAQSGDADAAPPAERRGFVASLRAWARDTQLLGRLNGEVDGWYPRLGGITRGSGFAGGPGIRGQAGPVFLDASGAMSLKGYKAVDVRARWLRSADRRVEVWTDFRYEDFPQEDFFGVGMQSLPLARTSFDFDSIDVGARVLVRPRRWLRLDAALGYQRPDVGAGTDDEYPSIEQRFTDADAPGLLTQPDFLHATVAAEIDYRDTAGNTSSGGLHRVSYERWNDVTDQAFDFHRFDARLMQVVPIVPNRSHVLAGRIGTSYVNNRTGHRVPFYALAYVGGMDSIRSFTEFRFEDENALWLSAEYKWRPARVPFLSVSVFADAGEVHANWEDIDFRGMKAGYGAGVGFHSPTQTLVRLDVGTGGGEGWQVFFKVRPAF